MRKIIVLLLLMMLISSCGSLTPAETAAPTEPDANESLPVEAADNESETPDDEGDDEPLPAETITPVIPASTSLACVPSSEHPDLAYTGYEEFPQAVLDLSLIHI